MAASPDPVVVAAAQIAPVFLDRAQTIEKACDAIAEAGRQGASLVVFPEVFVSGYPDWVWLVPNSHGAVLDELYTRLWESAVSVPDDATDALCRAARDAGVHVAIGVNERNDDASGASLYNSVLMIDDRGTIAGVHRKLVPTGGERLVWAQGDGSTLGVWPTAFARLGTLICWENLMPLARTAMYEGGAQIHLAPTWDKSPSWLDAMRYIAREGGMYVVSCCMALRRDAVAPRFEFAAAYPEDREWINTGNSCIVDPTGRVIAGPVSGEETILYAELHPGRIPAARRMFDVAGHYARRDVFRFGVRRDGDRRGMVSGVDEP